MNYPGGKSSKALAAHGLRKAGVSLPISTQAAFSMVSRELVPELAHSGSAEHYSVC
jgi:hypothetical protein